MSDIFVGDTRIWTIVAAYNDDSRLNFVEEAMTPPKITPVLSQHDFFGCCPRTIEYATAVQYVVNTASGYKPETVHSVEVHRLRARRCVPFRVCIRRQC